MRQPGGTRGIRTESHRLVEVHRLGARVGDGDRFALDDVAGPEAMLGLGPRADAHEEFAALVADGSGEAKGVTQSVPCQANPMSRGSQWISVSFRQNIGTSTIGMPSISPRASRFVKRQHNTLVLHSPISRPRLAL